MRHLIRLCVFGCVMYAGWQYYWSTIHCLEYNRMGVCLQRCETWEGWECKKIREKKQHPRSPVPPPHGPDPR